MNGSEKEMRRNHRRVTLPTPTQSLSLKPYANELIVRWTFSDFLTVRLVISYNLYGDALLREGAHL